MKRFLILILVFSCVFAYGKDLYFFGPGNPAFLTVHEVRGALIWKDGKHEIRPDFEKHIRNYANNGCNCIRFGWLGIWGDFTKKQAFTPFKYVDGKWDLDKFNPLYFEIVNEMIDICNRNGLTVWWVTWDMCATLSNQPIQKNPWCNNVQGIKHFMDDFGRSKKYLLKCLHEFKNRRVNYELFNEGDLYPKLERMRKFALEMWPIYHDSGIKPGQLCYGARYIRKQEITKLDWLKRDYKHNINKEDAHKIFRPVHVVGQADECGNFGCYFEESLGYWGGNPISTAFSPDGAFNDGYGVDCDGPGKKRCRPPADIIGKAFKRAYETHRFYNATHPLWFEIMPRDFFNIEMQTEEVRKISVYLYEASGKLPDNFDQYPPHECEIGDAKWIQFQGNPQGIKTHECKLCDDGIRRMVEIDYEIPEEPTEPEEKPDQKDGVNPLIAAGVAIIVMLATAIFGRKKNKK